MNAIGRATDRVTSRERRCRVARERESRGGYGPSSLYIQLYLRGAYQIETTKEKQVSI